MYRILYSNNGPSLINARPLTFCGEKADQTAIILALRQQTFLIFVKNLYKELSFLELLNCNIPQGNLLINYKDRGVK